MIFSPSILAVFSGSLLFLSSVSAVMPMVKHFAACGATVHSRRELVKSPVLVSADTGGRKIHGYSSESMGTDRLSKSQKTNRIESSTSILDLALNASGIPNPFLSFEGLSGADAMLTLGRRPANPPDTNGAVGRNHYVQTVNSLYSVYNKQGKALNKPTFLGSLFNNFSVEDCNNVDVKTKPLLTDPIISYDQLVHRWLISFITTGCGSSSSPCYICMAVSKTDDPLGDFYLYAMEPELDPTKAGNPSLPDYPKSSVWTDSYLLVTRDFGYYNFNGVSVYAFEKDKMIVGDCSATYQQFFIEQTDDNMHSVMLPPDIDGANVPPVGSPIPFVSANLFLPPDFALKTWKLQLNWTNPNSSSFLLDQLIPITPFNVFNCSNYYCIPQPGTNISVDTMYGALNGQRMPYRNFGCYESLLVSFVVELPNGFAAPRWFEIRRIGEQYMLYQESTFAPNDGVYRWMQSIAQDSVGNIAMGYSVSNGIDVYPGIRYTGRLANDPLNRMTLGEAVLTDGSGSATDRADRWGDYSSMTVDPVDDCTFYYTNMYYTSLGFLAGEFYNQINNYTDPLQSRGRFWQTRIGSFSLPGCAKAKKAPKATKKCDTMKMPKGGVGSSSTKQPNKKPTVSKGGKRIRA